MDTQRLSLIIEVARAASFAHVARAKGVDPSWVSRNVVNVETELGVRLFQRTTRQLTVTPAGAHFIAQIAPLVEGINEAADTARGNCGVISGTVRVTASVAFGEAKLVPLVGEFNSRYPAIQLDLVLDDRQLDMVAANIDLAVRLGPAVSGDPICSRLCQTGYRVVASPEYLAGKPPLRTPDDLSEHACPVFGFEPYRSRWSFRPLGLEGTVPITSAPISSAPVTTVPIKPGVVISSALGLRRAALCGLGPTLLADWLVDDDISAGRLVELLADYEVTATAFDTAAWLIYPSRTYLPVRVRATIDFLRAAFGSTARERAVQSG